MKLYVVTLLLAAFGAGGMIYGPIRTMKVEGEWLRVDVPKVQRVVIPSNIRKTA